MHLDIGNWTLLLAWCNQPGLCCNVWLPACFLLQLPGNYDLDLARQFKRGWPPSSSRLDALLLEVRKGGGLA